MFTRTCPSMNHENGYDYTPQRPAAHPPRVRTELKRTLVVGRMMAVCQFIEWLAADGGEPVPFGELDMTVLRRDPASESNRKIQLPP
jgi:hypothetical protein